MAEHDLETLFWPWGERFPSLTGMERWQWQDMPFWQVIADVTNGAKVVLPQLGWKKMDETFW